MRPPAGGQRYLILHAWLLQHRPRAQPSPRCDPGCCTTRRNRCQEESVAARPRHSREAGSCSLGPDRKKLSSWARPRHASSLRQSALSIEPTATNTSLRDAIFVRGTVPRESAALGKHALFSSSSPGTGRTPLTHPK